MLGHNYLWNGLFDISVGEKCRFGTTYVFLKAIIDTDGSGLKINVEDVQKPQPW
jgi:hypothetical protein